MQQAVLHTSQQLWLLFSATKASVFVLLLTVLVCTAVHNMPRGSPDNKRYMYSTATVHREGLPPAQLCQVTMYPDASIYLVRGQVHSMLAPAHVNASLMLRLLRHKIPHASLLEATLPIMLKLKAKQAVRPQASHAQLISISTVKAMLKHVGVAAATLDSLSSLQPASSNSTAAFTVSPAASDIINLHLSASLPAMLPKGQFSPQQLSSNYGLQTSFSSEKLLSEEPLQSQLQQFKAWMTQPINLARGQQKFISMLTWHKGFDCITNMYLGFCHKHKAVAKPSLEHFLDGNLFAAYTDFLVQRVSNLACHCIGQL